jgi:tetratricopeptide (TPR) repeat protein
MSLDALANVVRSPADHPEAFSRRGGDDRQRTLENVVRWSDNLLAPPLRTALRVLSAFPGGFSPSTARFALGYLRERGIEVAPDVSPLARRSLVDLDGDRFRMLHTVRSLAASWLGESPELSTAVEGMLLPWADQWARERVRLPYDQLRRDVRTELPNLLAAVHLGAIRCSVDVAYPLHLLCSVAPHEGAGPRLGATLRTVLKCPDTGASAVRSKVAAATMLSGIGVGEVPVDRAVMANWVRIADEDGDPELRAWSRSRLAQLLPVPEEVELARQWLREALELCGDSPEGLRNRARSYGGMGYVEHLAGELERAVDFYEQAASASQAASNSELVLIVRANKAEALLDLDRPAEALAAAQLALAYVDGQAAMAAVVSAMSGEAYAALGHADEGRALLAEAVDKLTELATLDPSLQYYVDRARAVLTAVN